MEYCDLVDLAPGAKTVQKVTLDLVGADDSSEEDVLRNQRSKRRLDPPPPARKKVKPASPPKPDPAESPASARARRRSSAGSAGNTPSINLEAEEDEAELDPAYLARKKELDLLRRKLHVAKANAIELPDDDGGDDDEPQEIAGPAKPVAVPPPQPSAPEPPARKLLLKVRTAAQAEPMPVRLYYDRPFEKLISSLASKQGVVVARVKLSFDGTVIKPTQTPASLELEDDDMLDLKIE